MKNRTGRWGDTENGGSSLPVSLSPYLRVRSFILHPSSFILAVLLLSLTINFSSSAQTRRRSGAHATAPETFTAADRTTVERAIGSACAERIRDPLGSTPIDVMQSRPSMSLNHPDAVAGAKRANRLLTTTKKLVANEIVQLAKEYGMYSGLARARVNAAAARVQAVKQVRPNVDARDNASVLLRDPREQMVVFC